MKDINFEEKDFHDALIIVDMLKQKKEKDPECFREYLCTILFAVFDQLKCEEKTFQYVSATFKLVYNKLNGGETTWQEVAKAKRKK